MGVTFIAKEGTYTAPATLTTKTITENGTYSAVDDSANGYSSVTVNVEGGGGGSSDFSTAEVTINWDASNPAVELLKDNCPIISVDTESNTEYINGLLYAETSPITVTVPLYKGGCYWEFSTKGVTLSGNIEPLYEGVLITGDCTITFS